MNTDIKKIMKAQRAFFESGVTKQYGFRMNALKRLEKALVEWEEDLKEALWQDLHKSPSESYMAEIGLVREEAAYVKRHLSYWMKPAPQRTSISQFPGRCFTLAEPYGMTLIMAPWNYPVLLCLEPLIDAIGAGNCVVLKPSAYAPKTSAVLRDMLKSIYPDKFVSVVEGGREANHELLEQRFDYIFFTGGVEVGRLVLEKAAKNLTPVTLELGGKSPCIVEESADLKQAAKSIIFGKILNSGQTCVAPDYLLVQKSIKDDLLFHLKKELEKALGKEPLQNPDYPKIINQKHFHRLLKLMEGEAIVTGGGADEQTGRIAPTILDDITLDSPIMKEEIFGPLLPILTFEHTGDLKAIIHRFEKPLAFYLFTRSRAVKQWALREFSFGGGCINDTILHLTSPFLPFGGVGFSGMGSYHGKKGFETFSHRKSIVDKRSWPDIPLRYQPYTGRKDWVIRKVLPAYNIKIKKQRSDSHGKCSH